MSIFQKGFLNCVRISSPFHLNRIFWVATPFTVPGWICFPNLVSPSLNMASRFVSVTLCLLSRILHSMFKLTTKPELYTAADRRQTRKCPLTAAIWLERALLTNRVQHKLSKSEKRPLQLFTFTYFYLRKALEETLQKNALSLSLVCLSIILGEVKRGRGVGERAVAGDLYWGEGRSEATCRWNVVAHG